MEPPRSPSFPAALGAGQRGAENKHRACQAAKPSKQAPLGINLSGQGLQCWHLSGAALPIPPRSREEAWPCPPTPCGQDRDLCPYLWVEAAPLPWCPQAQAWSSRPTVAAAPPGATQPARLGERACPRQATSPGTPLGAHGQPQLQRLPGPSNRPFLTFCACGRERSQCKPQGAGAVSYTHLTLPTTGSLCRSRWSPYH